MRGCIHASLAIATLLMCTQAVVANQRFFAESNLRSKFFQDEIDMFNPHRGPKRPPKLRPGRVSTERSKDLINRANQNRIQLELSYQKDDNKSNRETPSLNDLMQHTPPKMLHAVTGYQRKYQFRNMSSVQFFPANSTLFQELKEIQRKKKRNETKPLPPVPYFAEQGFCGGESLNRTSSLWIRFPDSVCNKTVCMYSRALKHGIKLSKLSRIKSATSPEAWLKENRDAYCNVHKTRRPKSKDIEISFIFTLHNAADMAARSILDVFSTVHEVSERTELVVVDDASEEDMSAVFTLCKSIQELFQYPVKLIKSTTNRGYGASNNHALRVARGRYAMLLNTDVFVRPGWVSALLFTMRTYPRAGMVGPMMLGLDGRVKEAGGFINGGGKPSNFGRRLMPNQVPYSHARPVDYISAACLLVRRQLFLDLGLFDPQFEPAYYEDTDAAMVHLKAGWLTIMQPLAVVTHSEGASIKSVSKERLMKENSARFIKKHKDVLDGFCPTVEPSCAGVSKISKLIGDTYSSFARAGPHVLVLEKHLPKPDRDSGSLRLTEIFRIFQGLGYAVSLETLSVPTLEHMYLVSLMAEGIYVHPVGMLMALARMKASGSSLVRCPWDVIFISKRDPWSLLGGHVKTVCPHAPIIYDTVDVHFIREERQLEMEGWGNQLNRSTIAANKAIELQYMAQSDVNLVVSSFEEEVLRQENKSLNVRVLSNIYPKPSRQDNISLGDRSGAIFVGNLCHHPNRDALDFILKKLAPQIKKAGATNLQITVVASNKAKCAYRRLDKYVKRHNVKLYVDVTDEELLYLHQKARMMIAPLRFGAGVKGKVNYALLHGLPVVATSVATEGMHMHNRRSVLQAEGEADFLAAMNTLATDDALWLQLQQGGWGVMEKYFTRDVARRSLTETLTNTLGLKLPAWGVGVKNPVPNLRKCPASYTTAAAACKGCWHCPQNKQFFLPPIGDVMNMTIIRN